jgi:hypothetical protein
VPRWLLKNTDPNTVIIFTVILIVDFGAVDFVAVCCC